MAGNLVKWWKHKILGGYKQFSVQECTTDSEELMYHQVRASSSCSAPPDLLMVSDRENNIPLRSPVVNIITTTTTTASATGNGHSGHQDPRHHIQQQLPEHHQQPHQHSTKDINCKPLKFSNGNKGSSKIANNTQSQHQHQQPVQTHQQMRCATQEQLDAAETAHTQTTQHQRHANTHQQHSKEEHIRLEEFTCDVSVEGGKSSQPLQFSFTFYDLDGHHGKITKDDIVGIVYTIYESIGKSVVVPHCGSKTINVRLTVSPEGKSKAAGSGKLRKMPAGGTAGAISALEHGTTVTTAAKETSGGHVHAAGRRQHRYRPRKLIKTDDEDDDSNSDKERDMTSGMALAATAAGKGKSQANKYIKNKMEQLHLQQQQQQQQQQQFCQRQEDILEPKKIHPPMGVSVAAKTNATGNCEPAHDSLYENMIANIKCSVKDGMTSVKKCDAADECGRQDSTGATTITTTTTTNSAGHGNVGRSPMDVVFMKQASSRVKMLRKARKQKYQDHCLESRQRSLSVGNETCWRNRHLMQQQQQQQQQQQSITKHAPQVEQQQLDEAVDGVQLRNPHNIVAPSWSQKRNSAECWKTALNRNDLISIIRESMEKNRLCFQLNGKPQANVSPIRQPAYQHQQHQALHQQLPPTHSQHQQLQQQQQQQLQQQLQRQRLNTASKIPTLIANHNNSIINHSSHISSSSSNNNNNNNTHNSNHHHHHHNHIELSGTHNDSSNSSLYHPQPHIPIYHQQLSINPVVLAAQNTAAHMSGYIGSTAGGGVLGLNTHSKMNLCGYDSFLHATICGGATNHSPPPPPTSAVTISQQPIATVQPILTTVPNQQQLQQNKVSQHGTPKMYISANSGQQHQIKTSKILRSGSYSQAQHYAATQNSPQYHGYQRLSSSANASVTQQNFNKHSPLAVVDKLSPVESLEKWLRKGQRTKMDKNYDNSIYAQLSEKLQDSSLHSGKENWQRRRQRLHKRHQSGAEQPSPPAFSAANSSSSAGSIARALIPINGDPLECENLIGQTTDEETSNELLAVGGKEATSCANSEEKVIPPSSAQVITATLVDLNDDERVVKQTSVSASAPNNVAREHIGEVEAEEEALETESVRSTSPDAANTVANTSVSSSLIHRYVHEHIHHHYHHFEDKDE